MHMIAIFEQLKLPFEKHLHLLFIVEDFIREKHKGGNWNFRLRENGTTLMTKELTTG